MLLHATDDEGSGTMTDTQLRDEALTIFLPGFETASNGLTWLLYLLASNPDVADRVAAESGALGDRPLGSADMASLPFTDRVVKESLRLYAPIWAYNRTPEKALTVGGFDILPGDLMIVSPAVLHSRPRYFSSPDRFDPDRFCEPKHPRYAHLPFGAGPHVCIGAQFATQELVLVTATLARRYRLELVPGQRVEPDALVSLRPKKPIRAGVVLRN